MKEQTIRLINTTINHLEQMAEAQTAISLPSLVGFVQAQIWTKQPIYHNSHYVHSIAWIAWNSTDAGKIPLKNDLNPNGENNGHNTKRNA